LWGKNRALRFDLRLEFLLEPLPHPFAAFHFHLQFHIAQGVAGTCIRVHVSPFVVFCFVSDEEPVFPTPLMVQVSSCAP